MLKKAFSAAGVLVLVLTTPADAQELDREAMARLEQCVKKAVPETKQVYLAFGNPRASIAYGRNQYIDLRTGSVVRHEGLSALGIKGGSEQMAETGFEALHPMMKERVDKAVRCFYQELKP